MAYPLFINKEGIREELIRNKIRVFEYEWDNSMCETRHKQENWENQWADYLYSFATSTHRSEIENPTEADAATWIPTF